MTETELKNLLKTVAPPDEAARAAAQAARALGDERTADYTDGVADDLVALAESAGHVIRR